MSGKKQGLLLGCFLFLGAGFALVVVTAMLLNLPLLGGGWSLGGQVGLVELEGPINASQELVRELEANRRDDSIHAVVLRVNSPGGAVAPSQEIYQAVRRLNADKPVVVSCGSVAASGAYYAAVAADSILADPGSLIGSIGVVFSYPTAPELMDKLGVELQVYKSGRLKDIGSFAREPTEEEEDLFDGIIADVYDQFITAVAEGRAMDRDEVLALADGRIFSGRQAMEAGLIDGLGDLHAAVNLAADLAGLDREPKVVRKARPRIPLLDILDQLVGDGAQISYGPRLEYRLR